MPNRQQIPDTPRVGRNQNQAPLDDDTVDELDRPDITQAQEQDRQQAAGRKPDDVDEIEDEEAEDDEDDADGLGARPE